MTERRIIYAPTSLAELEHIPPGVLRALLACRVRAMSTMVDGKRKQTDPLTWRAPTSYQALALDIGRAVGDKLGTELRRTFKSDAGKERVLVRHEDGLCPHGFMREGDSYIQVPAAEVWDYSLSPQDVMYLAAVRYRCGRDSFTSRNAREIGELLGDSRSTSYDRQEALVAAGRLRIDSDGHVFPYDPAKRYRHQVLYRPWECLRTDRTLEDLACLRSIPVPAWDLQEEWGHVVGGELWMRQIESQTPYRDDETLARKQLLWADRELVDLTREIGVVGFASMRDDMAQYFRTQPKVPTYRDWRSRFLS